MKKYQAVGIIFVIQYCYGAIRIYEDHEIEEQNCVAKIIQRIELVNTTNVALMNVDETLAKKLHSLSEPHLSFISRSFDWLNDTVLYGVYVIQCTNVSTFSLGLNLMKRDTFWNPRAKFVILFEDIEDFLQEISNFLLNNLIFDVVLVVCDDVYSFGLKRDECDRPVFKILRLLSHCSQVQNINDVYVAARKTSLRGCQVKFVAQDAWPFMFIRKDKFSEQPLTIEEYILELIAQIEQITIQVVALKGPFGDRLDNFTYIGLLHEVEVGNVEGAMGGYALTLDRAFNFDFMYPFMADHFVILTTRAQVLGNWSAVLNLIGAKTVWSVFGTFCIICVIVVSTGMFKGRVDVSRDVLIVWGYFLNNISPKHIKTGIPYRLLLWSILIFALIITCVTQAFLFSTTTKHIRGHQADTVDEVNSTSQLVMHPFVDEFLNTHSDITFSNVYNNTCNFSTCIMTSKTPLYTISSYSYDKTLLSRHADANGELQAYTIKELLGEIQRTMYVHRGSSLVAPMNRLILRVRSAGLIDKHLEKLIFRGRLIYEYRFHKPFKKKPLSLKSFKGVFMILIAGYCISTIFYVTEILH